jgi:hypothetical protein
MLRSPVGQHHLTNNTCTSDLLPRVAAIIIAGIIIVDLPTRFDHEQEKSNASPDYHCEHDKKCFHDSMLPKVPPREIYATIDCADDGENGFPRLRVGYQHWAGWEGASGPLMAARRQQSRRRRLAACLQNKRRTVATKTTVPEFNRQIAFLSKAACCRALLLL